MGHRLRQDSHPHHRICERTSAHHLVLILLRPAHPGLCIPRRPLVLHQEHQRRASLHHLVRRQLGLFRRSHGPSDVNVDALRLRFGGYRVFKVVRAVLERGGRAG